MRELLSFSSSIELSPSSDSVPRMSRRRRIFATLAVFASAGLAVVGMSVAAAQPTPSEGPQPEPPTPGVFVRVQGPACFEISLNGDDPLAQRLGVDGQHFSWEEDEIDKIESVLLTACE